MSHPATCGGRTSPCFALRPLQTPFSRPPYILPFSRRSTPPATGHSAELHCSQVGACKVYEGTHHTKGQTLLSTLRTAKQEEYHRGEENMVSPLPPPAKRPPGCIGTPQSQERATAGTAPLQTSLRNFFTTP